VKWRLLRDLDSSCGTLRRAWKVRTQADHE
jgi:hypothetical protein